MTILETIPKHHIPVYSTPIRISTRKEKLHWNIQADSTCFVKIDREYLHKIPQKIPPDGTGFQTGSRRGEISWPPLRGGCRRQPTGGVISRSGGHPHHHFVVPLPLWGRQDFSAPLGRRAGQCPAPTDTITHFRKIVGGGPM